MTETADPPPRSTSGRTDQSEVVDPEADGSRRSRAPLYLGLVVAGLCLLGGVAVGIFVLTGDDGGPSETVIQVPAGTSERLENGEDVELVPSNLELEVGDTLVIVNEDEALHQVGPYTVAPFQTLRQTFTVPGTIEGPCSLHPSGQVTLRIR